MIKPCTWQHISCLHYSRNWQQLCEAIFPNETDMPGKPKPRCGFHDFPIDFWDFLVPPLAFGEPSFASHSFCALLKLVTRPRGEEAKAAKWLKHQSCWSAQIIIPKTPLRPKEVQCFILLQQIPNVLDLEASTFGVGNRGHWPTLAKNAFAPSTTFMVTCTLHSPSMLRTYGSGGMEEAWLFWWRNSCMFECIKKCTMYE